VNQEKFGIVVYTDKGLSILSSIIRGMKKNPYDFVCRVNFNLACADSILCSDHENFTFVT